MNDDDIPLIDPGKIESDSTIGFWDGTPYDVNGVRVVELCDCGKEATTFIQSVNAFTLKCHECMFGKSHVAKFVYKPPPLKKAQCPVIENDFFEFRFNTTKD